MGEQPRREPLLPGPVPIVLIMLSILIPLRGGGDYVFQLLPNPYLRGTPCFFQNCTPGIGEQPRRGPLLPGPVLIVTDRHGRDMVGTW